MYIDILLSDENMVSFDEFIDFDYKINSSDNNELLIGNCSAASLNFNIWNEDKKYNTFKFKNSTCYLYKDMERTQKIGVFKVDKITKEKNSLRFECTDNMTKLDEIFKGISTPFNLFSLIVQICIQLDIPLKNTEEDFINMDLTFNDTKLILGKKCREVLKLIAEITCSYVIFNEEGELYFNWYDLDTIKKEIPYNSLKEFARDEEELIITGVSVVLENEEQVVGTKSGYDLRLTTDNPFLKVLSLDERTRVLQSIYDKVYGMHYLSCDISLSIDDEIKIGDTLKIYDEDGIDYKILVTYLNISKLFSMKITSSGENVNRDTSNGSSSSSSDSSTQEKTYIAKDETWRDMSIIDYHGETHLNSISAFGINEKSSVFLSFSISFMSTVESSIKFKLYVNDILSKEFPYETRLGDNFFTWSEVANIKIDSETNSFKIVIDTSDFTTDFAFYIDKGNSVLSIISTGARVGTNIITNLEFREEIRTINLLSPYNKLIIGTFEDILSVSNKEYLDNSIEESIGLIQFKPRNKINIHNINESIE